MYREAKRENESAPVRIEGNRFGIALVLTSRRVRSPFSCATEIVGHGNLREYERRGLVWHAGWLTFSASRFPIRPG